MGKDLYGRELGPGIIQRKNGRYEARYNDRFGKRISISGYELKDVKKRYHQALYYDEKEINVRKDITLDAWYSRWMNEYKYDILREDSKRHYNCVFRKHISPYLGKYKLRDIKQLDIKKRINELEKAGYGFETRNKVRVLLVDVFNKALLNDYIIKNPASGITLKRDVRKEIRVLSTDEQTVFFDCCRGTFYDNLFVVAVTTGMRIGELAGLKWSDIDMNKKVISINRTLVYQQYDSDSKKEFHIEDPKTAASKRIIPINRQCELAL